MSQAHHIAYQEENGYRDAQLSSYDQRFYQYIFELSHCCLLSHHPFPLSTIRLTPLTIMRHRL